MLDVSENMFCSTEWFTLLLIVNGILAYLVIHSRVRIIGQIKNLDEDLYRAILFPKRALYEADFVGIADLLFFTRFRKAILSKDFHELNHMIPEVKRASFYTTAFLCSLFGLLLWMMLCP